MRRFWLCCWFLGGLWLSSGLLGRVSAAPPALVVVLLPGSLHDWQSADAPHLHSLMQTGAIAVMNTRTAHRAGGQERESPQSALLTLGAGARAAGTGTAAPFLLVKAVPGTPLSAGALFERRTGLVPPPGQSVCLDWPAVVKANTNLGYDLHLGSLADTLTVHGFRVEAGGGPEADWVAAGSSGIVQHTARLQAAPGLCLIWDAGANIPAADADVASAAAQADALGSRLVVVSPYASDANAARNDRLTPVLVWGKDVPAGLLSSSSTRRPGLVTNTDFAPSVAAFFGIARSQFRPTPFGFPWSAEASRGGGVSLAAQISREAVQQAQGMRLLPYLAVVLGLFLLAATAASRRVLFPAALAWVPLAALTAALLAVSTLSFWALLPSLIGLSVVLTRWKGSSTAGASLTISIIFLLIADMLTGSHLMQRSLLGYSAIEGARYYGIGNESMGLLLGGALTVAAQFWPAGKAAQFFLVVLMGTIVLLLGSAGAKAGGVLVSLAVFGTFLFAASGRRWSGRSAVLLGVAVLAGIAMAALGDAFLLPGHTHSHVGEAVQRIASGGPSEAADIVQRKLAVEGRLAYHSAWAVLLWLGVVCTTILWKKQPLEAQAGLRSAGLVGVISCLLLNDAGVVAAAIFSVFLWSETQKSRLKEISEPGRSFAGPRADY